MVGVRLTKRTLPIALHGSLHDAGWVRVGGPLRKRTLPTAFFRSLKFACCNVAHHFFINAVASEWWKKKNRKTRAEGE